MSRGFPVWFVLGAFALVAADAPRAPGVGNFHQVDERVYRGAQPTSEGFRSLAKLGIRTVVDLRGHDHRAGEKDEVEALGMRYVHAPVKEFGAPADADIAKALAAIDSNAAPVFVHCKRGKDRTGTVIACYRIQHDNWDNEKALAEARSLGMSSLEHGMMDYIRHFQPSR